MNQSRVERCEPWRRAPGSGLDRIRAMVAREVSPR